MTSSPAQPVSVNLLEHENSNDSIIARLISWAVTYGRYIMIGTEVIVLLAFISRFSLDRKLTDLREEINQKKIILQANQQFENEFRATQKRLDTVRSFLNNQTQTGDSLFLIHRLLPQDVYLTEFFLSGKKITFAANAGTTASFSQFLSLLTSQKEFAAVELTDIRKNTLRGIEFRIAATLK
jgi:Tfp pilus assembly protein PilN